MQLSTFTLRQRPCKFKVRRLNTKKSLLHSLGQSYLDLTANVIVFVNEADNPSIEPMPSPLISDNISMEPKSAAQDDFAPVINDIIIDPASTTKYLPFDCQKKIKEMSEGLDLLKQENRQCAISFRLLMRRNKALSPLCAF